MEDPAELLDSKAELDQEEIERLLRENRALKGRLDELERENRLLKQRNFDLSMRYGRSVENRRQPFEIVFSDSDLDEDEDEDDDDEDRENGGNSDERGSNVDYDNEVSDDISLDNEKNGHTQSRNSVAEDAIKVTPGNRSSIGFSLATTGNSSISSVTFSEACIEGSARNADNGTRCKKVGGSYNSVSDSATDSDVNNLGSKAPSNYTSHKNSQQDVSGVYGGSQSRPTDKRDTMSESIDLSNKEDTCEKPVRFPEIPDSDRDGVSKQVDIEAATAAKERRGQRDNEEQRLGSTNSAGGGVLRRKEAKQLKCYAELDGHEGAIYSTQYSPSGSLVASASFDKTIRIWDIGEQKQIAALSGHQQTAFDIAWRYDSAAVVSAGFDRVCIEWDLEAKQATSQLQCDGLVQCVRYSTHNPRIVYSGDSSGFISIHDLRQPQGATKLSNDGSMVNTIYCFNDETRLVSGDRNGEIKMWDVRIGRFMRLVNSSTQSHAISYISVVKNEKSGTEYMATNSYDNVLRVYDRVDDPSVPTPRAIHELRGIRSRNWPIKNAFFDPLVAQEQLLGLYNDDYYELDTRLQSEARGLQSMLFLITGSAEPYAYLYKLDTHSKLARIDNKAKRDGRQRLEGHSDRVYAVATHPTEIKACTAGADSTVRLWHVPSAGRLLKEGNY
ncbi:hypothetical protein IW138_001354 [Coemansia sp. RSA 986]|nr:hypothetical protein IW138_001354 [Coemansia sp. RSA 986]